MVVYLDDAEQWIKNNRLNWSLNTITNEEGKWLIKCCSELIGNNDEIIKLNIRKNILHSTLLKFIAYFIQKISDENNEGLMTEQKDNIPYISLDKATKLLNCHSNKDIIQCAINNDSIRIFVKAAGKRSKLFIGAEDSSIYGITQFLVSKTGKNKEIIDNIKKLPIFELKNKNDLYGLFNNGKITFKYLYELNPTKEATMYGISVGADPLGSQGEITLDNIFIHREDISKIKECLNDEFLQIKHVNNKTTSIIKSEASYTGRPILEPTKYIFQKDKSDIWHINCYGLTPAVFSFAFQASLVSLTREALHLRADAHSFMRV